MKKNSRKRPRPVRTPTILQMESTECGAASLGILLAYFGRHVPLEDLRVECRVSRDGSNALYVKKTAEKFGLTGKGFQISNEEVRYLQTPFLVFWELNHFLVVEGFGRDRVYLNDPATGRRTVSDEQFRDSFTGIAFQFEPGPAFEKGGTRPRLGAAIARRLNLARRPVAFVILAGLALMGAELINATFSLIFVDQIVIAGRRNWIRPLLLAMGFFAVFRGILVTLQRGAMRRLKLSLATVQSAKFFWHVLRLPISFFQQRYAGDVSDRIDSNSTVADLLTGELATTAVGMMMIVFYAAMMFAFAPVLAAVGILIGSLNLVGILAVNRTLSDEYLKLKQDRAKLYASMMRMLQMIETIKASASEDEALTRLTGHQARITNSTQVVSAKRGLLIAMPPLLSVLTTASILWLGGLEVATGAMSIGVLVALQALLAQFQQPFTDLVRLGTNVQTLQAEITRLEDVQKAEVDPVLEALNSTPPFSGVSENSATPGRIRRLSGQLELRGVTFGFNRTLAEPLIDRFSLELKPGSRVALVGGSGSGKSTIGRLVAGLYHPWEGEILYDGRRLQEIPRDVFTDQVALIDDQTFLFEGTVGENLTLWDDAILDREIQSAAMDAEIHRDLIGRSGGYRSRIAEAARNLSGGQRQRMEIARALVRNPALLILDEATSALDPVTEALVDDNLRRRGCTCLIIAHRLSTIRDCDEIVVLRQGRVIQRGTHDDLMADKNGFYFELQSLQDNLSEDLSDPREAPDYRGGRLASSNGKRNGVAVSAAAHAEPTNGHPVESPLRAGGFDALHVLSPAAAVADPLAGLHSQATRVSTAANAPLPLNDEGAVWKVVSGKVDVFHSQPESAHTQSRRRHLFRVEEGGAIFAIEGVRGQDHGEFIAVGVGSAQLDKMQKADLMRSSFDPSSRSEVASMVDDWVERISRASAVGDPPPSTTRLKRGAPRNVAANQAIASHNQVLWIRQSDSAFALCGKVAIPPCDNASRFPLSTHAWLTADAPGEINAIDTESLMENGDPWLGLKRFHKAILDAIAVARTNELAQLENRRNRLVRHDQAVFLDAIAALSFENSPRSANTRPPSETDRLLLACRAVGVALGVKVNAPTLEGTSDPLRLIARASRLRTRRVRLALGWWQGDGAPFLGYIAEGNDPVAIVNAPAGGYDLVDEMRGTRTKVTAEIAQTLSSSAVTFYRTLSEDRLKGWELVRFSLPTIRRDLRKFIALGSLAGLFALAIPALAAIAIDDAIPRADHTQLGVLCAFLATIGASVAAFQLIQSLVLVRIRGRLESELVPAAWDRLLNMPTQFFARFESGDLAFRAMGFCQFVGMLSSTWATSLLVGVFSLLNLLILFWYNAKLALIALGLILISPIAATLILRPLWRSQRRLLKTHGEIFALLLVLIGGIARIRVAGAEKRAFSRWAEKYKRQLEFMLRLQTLTDRLNFFCDLWPLCISMVIFGLFVTLGAATTTAGEFLAFNLAVSQAVMAMIGVIHAVPPMLDGWEQYDRFRPVFDESPEGSEVQGEVFVLQGAIRVANVSFRYDPMGPLILDSVNIQVRPGEFVAIVGPSGSGKSSLLRLLLGFEKPTEGAVTYDGRELSNLDIKEVRRQLGVVLQDSQLRTGDIFSNIVGTTPGLTRDDAMKAAELAGLADDIEQMPMGIHTTIGEGAGGLSSGQRQRLLVARALAGQPKILYFDEATSALDNRSQAVISNSVNTKLQGTTRVVIAHRLSTIVDADRIYVLSGGKVVQSGPYAQLIKEPGPFQNLARRQTLV